MAKAARQIRILLGCLLLIVTITWPLHAQNVTKAGKRATVLLDNIRLEEALTIMGISYGVQFSYSDDIVPTQSIVNLSIQNETLEASLSKLLIPYGISFRITGTTRVVLRKLHMPLTQTVRGTIIDEVTHGAIPGASIIIQNSSPLLGSTANENGEFNIEHSPIGRLTIMVSSVGYDTRTLSGLLLGTGKELVLEVALAESITSMNEVVISAPKNDGIPGDGMAVTSSKTFTVEETKRYAGSLGDPARMASGYAGVTSGSDDNNALIVRGNSPRGVLWRVEGIEIPNPNHFTTEGASSGMISVLSPNMISGSDFLTGAFPAQYGNALSAVLDISLRNGNSNKYEHSIQAGLMGLEASSEGPLRKKQPASYLANYRYSTLSVLDNLGFKLNDVGQYKNYEDLSFKINYPTAHAGTFSLFGIGGKSRSSLSDTTLSDNRISNIGILGLTYKNMINESTYLHGSISYAGTQISSFKKIDELSTGAFFTNENYSKSYARAALTLRKKITNKYYAEAGFIISDLRHNFYLKTIDPNNVAYPVVVNFSEADHHNSTIVQGFLYARQYFSSSVFGFYGVHFLRFSLTSDYSIEPRAGLRWQVAPSRSFSVAYGKHSRIENLQYYLARDHQSGGNEVQVNKNLGFTRAHHVVFSYDQAISAKHHLKAETYFQQLYNVPVQSDPASIYASLNEDTGFITDSLINNGSGRNYGVELSLEKSFSNNVYYLVNGSVFQSRFTIDNQPERNTAYDGNYSIHALGGKEFEIKEKRNRIGINVKVTQAGGRRYVPIDLSKSIEEKRQVHNWNEAFAYKLPAYFRADLQIVYKINKERYSFEWRLDIQNITNHRNAAWYYYDQDTQSVKLKKQIGIIPLLSCRIDF